MSVCLITVVLENIDVYKNGKISLKQPRITMAIMGNMEIKNIIHLRSTLKESDSNQMEWDNCFDWHAETSKRLQDSKIGS